MSLVMSAIGNKRKSVSDQLSDHSEVSEMALPSGISLSNAGAFMLDPATLAEMSADMSSEMTPPAAEGTSVAPAKKRRLVANARERSRVHTISAAFEAVRRQIPVYAVNQKMSKLSILRIATSYIQALTVMVQELDNLDEEASQEKMTACTKTIQVESRTKSRKSGK